eukprot:7843781-Alexandrium_andersonii.AAC.1
MSASLVGSEMCIRDRPLSSASSCHLKEPVFHGLGCQEELDLVKLGPAAVSYTHLTLPTICSV